MPDNYQSPPGRIGNFHPDLDMSPYKAASLLRKAAKMHAKGRRGKMGKAKAAPSKGFMPQRQSYGARVFGGKK